jgi:hypothetical protein
MKTAIELSMIVKDYVERQTILTGDGLEKLIVIIREQPTLQDAMKLDKIMDVDGISNDDVWMFKEFIFNIYRLMYDNEYITYLKDYAYSFNCTYEMMVDKEIFETIKLSAMDDIDNVELALLAIYITIHIED